MWPSCTDLYECVVGFCVQPCAWKSGAEVGMGSRVCWSTHMLYILWTQKDIPFIGVYKHFDYLEHTSLERCLPHCILKVEQDLFPRSYVPPIKLIWWQFDNIKMMTLETSPRIWVSTLHNLMNGAITICQIPPPLFFSPRFYKNRETTLYTYLKFRRFSLQLQLKSSLQKYIWNSEELERTSGT